MILPSRTPCAAPCVAAWQAVARSFGRLGDASGLEVGGRDTARTPGGDPSCRRSNRSCRKTASSSRRAEFVAQANVKKADFDALSAEGRARLRGLLGGARARDARLAQAVHEGARRIEGAVLQVVRRRRAERLVQLPRPPPRERQRATRSRSSSRPTTARSRRSPTASCITRVCQLRQRRCKALGIKKGDRVLIYMPMSIEAVVAMQACARIGATHSVVFGGFSAKSAAGAHHRRRRRRGHHRRRADARRQGDCR